MTTIELTLDPSSPEPTIALAASSEPAGCCTPAAGDVVDGDTARDLARRLKALADPTRVQLLSIVAAHDGHEACVCDLTDPVGLSQPTVSHHLKILVDAGLLHREQRGRWAYFSLVPGALPQLASTLTGLAA